MVHGALDVDDFSKLSLLLLPGKKEIARFEHTRVPHSAVSRGRDPLQVLVEGFVQPASPQGRRALAVAVPRHMHEGVRLKDFTRNGNVDCIV